MEKGRTLVKAEPPEPHFTFSKTGIPVLMQARITRGAKGDALIAMHYVWTVGARFQHTAILAFDEKAMKEWGPGVNAAFQQAEITLPKRTPSAWKEETQLFRFFNYSFRHPRSWQRKDAPLASAAAFDLPVARRGALTAGYPFQVVAELQARRPHAPQAALVDFLERRAPWNFRAQTYGKDRVRVVGTTDGVLPNGLTFVSVVIERTPTRGYDGYRKGGFVISGPGYSVLLGTAFHMDHYNRTYKPTEYRADLAAWQDSFEALSSALATVSLAPDRVSRNEPGEKELVRRRSLRYNREVSISGGSASFFSSTKVEWDFGTDSTARYNIDRFRTFTAYDYDRIGRPDFSSGYGTEYRGTRDNRAFFRVWNSPEGNYLVLYHSSGITTFHTLRLDPHFEIDGYRDGCCR